MSFTALPQVLSRGLQVTETTVYPFKTFVVCWGRGGGWVSHTIHLTEFVLTLLNFLIRVKKDFPRAFPFLFLNGKPIKNVKL